MQELRCPDVRPKKVNVVGAVKTALWELSDTFLKTSIILYIWSIYSIYTHYKDFMVLTKIFSNEVSYSNMPIYVIQEVVDQNWLSC